MSVIRHPNTAGATLTQWRYTATGGETSLSGTDGFSTALSYTVGSEQVFINGVLLERGVDYVATTGTTITGLTALVVNDIATVISPSSFNVANAIPKSTVTAKGDLLVASGASTPINLAVGADGTTLVANSSSSTGVAWAGPAFTAGKNKIINGDFGVWQRGTSFNLTGTDAYTVDRFLVSADSATGTPTLTQQTFTPGTAPVAGYEGTYFPRITLSSSNTAWYFSQRIEDVRIFAGQTVTLSFWAKSSSSQAVQYYFRQNFGTGGSSNINLSGSIGTIGTSWQRFTQTITLGSMAGKTIGAGSYMFAQIFNSSGVVASSTIDIWGMQLEAGSVATAFQTATGTVQGELAACQRYYEKSYPLATAPGSTSSQSGLVNYIAITSSAINNRCWVPFIVSKRTSSPTITIWSYHTGASGYAYNEGTGSDYSIGIQFQAERGFNLYPTSGSFSAGQVCNFYYTADSEL